MAWSTGLTSLWITLLNGALASCCAGSGICRLRVRSLLQLRRMSSKGVTIENGLTDRLTSQPVPMAGISPELVGCLVFALPEVGVGCGGCQDVQAGVQGKVKGEHRI